MVNYLYGITNLFFFISLFHAVSEVCGILFALNCEGLRFYSDRIEPTLIFTVSKLCKNTELRGKLKLSLIKMQNQKPLHIKRMDNNVIVLLAFKENSF